MKQAIKKNTEVLHWFGVGLRMGGHNINNDDNENKTVIP